MIEPWEGCATREIALGDQRIVSNFRKSYRGPLFKARLDPYNLALLPFWTADLGSLLCWASELNPSNCRPR